MGRYLYTINRVRQQAADHETIDNVTYQARLNGARNEFYSLSNEMKSNWKQRRLEHIRQWPTIKETLMRELQNNNAITYQNLSSEINYWCGAGTIQKWVQSRDGYLLYVKRIIPLLSTKQKSLHLECAKRIRSNLGLGSGKYLWVHYNKKWFWGLVLQKTQRHFGIFHLQQ